MPYYAYVNGKATIGLETVDQINKWVKDSYSDYKIAEVKVLDMMWKPDGTQDIVDSYTMKKGKRVKSQQTE